MFLDVFAATAVYSLAHVYADLLDERVHHAAADDRAGTTRNRREGFAILRATAVPFVTLLVCSVLRVGVATSVTVAMWLLVAELAVTSWYAAGAIQPWSRRITYAAGATMLGLLLILLKIATH